MADNQTQISEIIFKWQNDKTSQSKAVREIESRFESLKKQGASTGQAVKTSSETAAAGLDNTKRSAASLNTELEKIARQRFFDRLIEETNKEIKAGKDLNQVFRELDNTLRTMDASQLEIGNVARGIEPTATGNRADGARRLGALGQIGVEIRNLPAIGPSETIAKIMRSVDIASQSLGISLTSLGVAGGIAAGAIGAIVVAVDLFNKGLEKSRVALENAFNAQRIYYSAVSELTEAQAREDIAAREQNLERIRNQIRETQSVLDSQIQGAQQNGPLQELIFFLAGTEPLEKLRTQIRELSAERDVETQAIDRLNTGLEQGVFAANDAAEAERQLAEARGLLLDAEQRAFTEGVRLTDEQIQERIRTLYDERNAIEKYINVVQPTGERLEAAQAQMASLTNQIVGFTHSMEYNTDAVQQGDAAIKKLTNGIASMQAAAQYSNRDLTSALENTHKAQEAVAKAQESLVTAQNEAASKVAEEQRKADEDLAKLRDDYNTEARRDAEDLADDLKKIRDEERFDVLNAIGERDAKSAYLARQTARKEEGEATKQAAKMQKREQEDYDKRYRNTKIAGERRIELERQQGAAEVAAKRAALVTTQNDLLKATMQQQLIHRTMYGGILTDAIAFSTNFQSIIKQALTIKGNTGSSKSGTGKGGITYRQFQQMFDQNMSEYRQAGAFG